ncbi:hypothetical protein FVP33_02575, partial [Lacisediminihabitans profunda]
MRSPDWSRTRSCPSSPNSPCGRPGSVRVDSYISVTTFVLVQWRIIMTDYILSIDQGTTSTRAIVFDHAGSI